MKISKFIGVILISFFILILSGSTKPLTLFDKIDNTILENIKEIKYESGPGGSVSTTDKDIINKLRDVLKSTKIWDSHSKDEWVGGSYLEIIAEDKDPIPINFEGDYLRLKGDNTYYSYDNKDEISRLIKSLLNLSAHYIY